MSTPDEAREELRALIHDIRLRPVSSQMDGPFADAILAAGYRKLGPVTDAEVEAATEALTIRRHTPAGWASPDVARAALEASRSVLGGEQ